MIAFGWWIQVACVAISVIAIAAQLLRWRRARRYAKLLEECLERQVGHEAEHLKAHGGHFTSALRIEAIANRFERKIHAAGLSPLSLEDRRNRAKEALWPRK